MVLKLDNVNGQVVYKDKEGWKFYCWINEIEKLKSSQFDGEFQFPELQQDIQELTKEEYQEI